jgi:hypothetical protein
MNYSNQDEQNKLADQFALGDASESILNPFFYISDKKFHRKTALSKKEKQKIFTANVLMAMARALRNLGLVRDTHVSYLELLEDDYKSEKSYQKDVLGFGSKSTPGLFAKFLPFFGGDLWSLFL